jgi:hypothetical protein
VEQKKTKKSNDVLAKHKAQIPAKEGSKDRPEFKAKPKDEERVRGGNEAQLENKICDKKRSKSLPKGNQKHK